MKYNHSAMRQRFMREQKALAKKYRAAGMSEDSIREMYEFDLSVFRSNRNDLAHKAEIEEMTAYDRVTGESHYMDMDEFPTFSASENCSFDEDTWIDNIENQELFNIVNSLSSDSKQILFWMMCGLTQPEIAGRIGISQPAISQRIAVIKRKINRHSPYLSITLHK